MDYRTAQMKLGQLYEYSQAVAKFLGVPFSLDGKNHHGQFLTNMPCGAIMHYTASNTAYSSSRPYGRYPYMRERFARGGKQGVGVHFIVWDSLIPRFKEIQDRFPELSDMPTEIAFMGDDLAFWHAGSANRWAYGVEIRNVGKVLSDSAGNLFWGGKSSRYHGRTPIKIGRSLWEPYTRAQMKGVLWLNRIMSSLHTIKPECFLGHVHVSSTRIDPGPHFPIHEMRQYSVQDLDTPLDDVKFLLEFQDDDVSKRDEPMVSEESYNAGLYRHDWDGISDDWDGTTEAPEAPELTSGDDSYKDVLRSLGYYVTDKTVVHTVAIFRERWKERSPGKKGLRNMLPTAGGMDSKATALLDRMRREWDNL